MNKRDRRLEREQLQANMADRCTRIAEIATANGVHLTPDQVLAVKVATRLEFQQRMAMDKVRAA